MKTFLRFLFLFVALSISTFSHSQVLVSVTDLGIFPKSTFALIGFQNAQYNIQMYKVTYNTLDNDGNNVEASGMVAVPIGATCDSLPISLYTHGTVLLREDVPSRNNLESIFGKAIASSGYITAMPDYLGLGDLQGLHPYQHAESEARVSIDILRATKELIEDSLTYTYKNEYFITGYSQGGHAAMASIKYIEDNNLTDEFNVIASAPLSGSVNASATQTDIIIDDLPFGNQGFVIYIIMAYQETYGGIYNTPSDFLQSPYDQTIPPLMDGNHDLEELNDSLPVYASDYLDPTFLANLLADTTTKSSPLWQALLDNDNYDWKPTGHLKMFYCSGDQTVFPENTTNAFEAMINNGATKVFKEDLGNFSHGGCATPALQSAIMYFDSLRPDCNTPSSITNVVSVEPKIQVAPNPANELVQLSINSASSVEIVIYSVTGREIFRKHMNQNLAINVSSWTKGIYFIQATGKDFRNVSKLAVQH